MKNTKNIILILLLMMLAQICVVNLAIAQDTEKTGNIFSFVPQSMILHGIRVDWETNTAENKWIQLCPEVYFANGDYYNGDDSYNELVGGGLRFYKKRYVNKGFLENTKGNVNELGIYLGIGPTYQYFQLNYLEDDNASSYEYEVNIHKVGFDILLGYQFLIKDIVSIDVYTGLGTRYSFTSSEGEREDLFDDTIIGYGYTGNLIQGGLRIGLKL